MAFLDDTSISQPGLIAIFTVACLLVLDFTILAVMTILICRDERKLQDEEAGGRSDKQNT